ncbi:MAG: hypothetical protein LBC74_16005, partial [Planctomycetaceae bacterium]|nr:hypothetical protein [Planctomycetaceae bacterium]
MRKLPSNVDGYERVVMLRTGLRWEIGSVEYCKSNHVKFRNVRLFHANSAKPFFAASVIDLVYILDDAGKTGNGSNSDRNRLFPGVVSSRGKTKISDKTLDKSDSITIFGSIKRFLGIGDSSDGFWHISVVKSLVDLGESGTSNVFAGESSTADEVELRECFLELASRMEFLSQEPILIMFDEIDVIATSLKRFKVRFVAGNLYQTEAAIRSEWSLLIPIVSETEREQISIVRRRNSRNLSVTLKTGNMPLPCE